MEEFYFFLDITDIYHFVKILYSLAEDYLFIL